MTVLLVLLGGAVGAPLRYLTDLVVQSRHDSVLPRGTFTVNVAGASVFHGVEGFGRSHTIHTTRILSLGDDLPCAVVVVDTEEAVRGFLPQLDGLVGDGLVTLDHVEVVTYAGGGEGTTP